MLPEAGAGGAPTQGQPETENDVFVQAGAFGDSINAQRRYALLRSNGVTIAFVHKDETSSPPLYRVRIGPITSVEQYDALVTHLTNLGISDTHLVTD